MPVTELHCGRTHLINTAIILTRVSDSTRKIRPMARVKKPDFREPDQNYSISGRLTAHAREYSGACNACVLETNSKGPIGNEPNTAKPASEVRCLTHSERCLGIIAMRHWGIIC